MSGRRGTRSGLSLYATGSDRNAAYRSGVSTARAKIVDNAALADLLRAGRIAGAAFDVYDEEPVPPGPHIFRDLPNVLITPHIGYNTHEASLNMLNIAIATIAAHLKGERLHVVNPDAFAHRSKR